MSHQLLAQISKHFVRQVQVVLTLASVRTALDSQINKVRQLFNWEYQVLREHFEGVS